MADFNDITDFNNMEFNNIALNNIDINNVKLHMFNQLSAMNIKVKSLDSDFEENPCDLITSYWLVS